MFNVDSKQPLLTPQTKHSYKPSIFISIFCFFLAFASLYFVLKDSQQFFEESVGGNSFGMEGVSQPATPRAQSVPASGAASPAGGATPGGSVPNSPDLPAAGGPSIPNPSPMLAAVPGGNISPSGSTPESPKPDDAAAASAAAAQGESSPTVVQPSAADEEDEAEGPADGPAAGAIILDMPPEALQEGSTGPAAASGTKCNDPSNGYEAQFGLCRDIRVEHRFQRTAFETTYIPMVIDQVGTCKKDKCSIKDKWRCCKFRRQCAPNYAKDVSQGCPAGKALNPYEGAYCRTFPCTVADADICCINPTGTIYKRTDSARSKYARVDADDKAKPTVPHMSFSYGISIWTDITQKVTVGDDEWVPLVNFMESWGDGFGWSEPAWVKFSKNKKAKYAEVKFN